MSKLAAHFRTLSVTMSLMVACLAVSLGAQSQTSPASSVKTVPAMVRFSGTVTGAPGRLVGLTFAFYRDQTGGAPLWLETQSVAVDASGHYTVQLGATLPNGVPEEFFVSGEARWMGVQREGQPEQPRVLLLSVPYAMKAADAETLGGLPASAFALAAPTNARAATSSVATVELGAAPPANGAVTGAGTVNSVPLWDTASDIISSAISQVGTGATAKIGINNAAPVVTLDVKGATSIRGLLTLPTTGNATATVGKNSQPLNLSGSAFNSGTATAVNQTFRLQTEPAANNTASASGKLNLLYYAGANAAAETGLSIASNGHITFAPGQAFPGTGAGTITGVTAGTALTGGGTIGSVTLNLDATKVPLLNAANIFAGNQTVTGNLTASGTVSASVVNASVLDVGGNAIAFGSPTTLNAFLGFAGNSTTTGGLNTGTGVQALLSNTTGSANTATGSQAMGRNKTGTNNTAFGNQALALNTDGYYNTAVGALALFNTIGYYNTGVGLQTLTNNTGGDHNVGFGYNAGPDSTTPDLTNSAAIGSYADVSQSNSLVLGSIKGINGATADTLVGIGTTAPGAKLDVHGTANFTGLVTFAAGQTFPGAGTVTGVTAGTGLTGGGTSGNVTLNLDATKIPQLSAANTFTGNQTVNANLTATGTVSAASYQIGSNLFASGNATSNNVYLGFAGNKTTTGFGNTGVGGEALAADAGGTNNTATGQAALPSNTAGTDNVAMGVDALQNNTLGNFNTGIGVLGLASNTSGTFNTALGFGAGPDAGHPNLNNATAIGANAVVSESNALVLGGTGSNGVNVGIGTTAPAYPLQVVGVMRSEAGLSLGGNSTVAVDAPGIVGGHFSILANGNVGINKANPTTNLDVAGNIAASGTLVGGSLNVGGGGVINGGLSTSAGITTGAGVSVGGPLSIRGDTPMNAAPHMFFSGTIPGGLTEGELGAFAIPSRDILITRMSFQMQADANGCSPPGTLSLINWSNFTPYLNMNISQVSNINDSGPLSIAIPAGTPIGVWVSNGPSCGIFGGAAGAAISVEYVMQ